MCGVVNPTQVAGRSPEWRPLLFLGSMADSDGPCGCYAGGNLASDWKAKAETSDSAEKNVDHGEEHADMWKVEGEVKFGSSNVRLRGHFMKSLFKWNDTKDQIKVRVYSKSISVSLSPSSVLSQEGDASEGNEETIKRFRAYPMCCQWSVSNGWIKSLFLVSL